MEKIKALWGLFKQGQCVSDPTAWKNRQITATGLGLFLMAVINVGAAFGYAIPIDTETANAIAAGIIAIVNAVLTLITSDKVGIPAKESTAVKEAIQEKPKVQDEAEGSAILNDPLYR